MTNDYDKAIKKVENLLKITTKNGATEDEAFNAIKKAKSLMDKFNITENDIKNKKVSLDDYGFQQYKNNTNINIFDHILGNAIGKFNNTIYMVQDNINLFFGNKIDVDFSVRMKSSIDNFIISKKIEYCISKGLTHKDEEILNSFEIGLVHRIEKKINDLFKANEKSLVVLKNELVLSIFNQYVSDNTKKENQLVEYDENKASFRDGYEKGESVEMFEKMEK